VPISLDRQTFSLGFFNFRNGFLGRYMDDVNRTARDPSIVEIGPGMSCFRECRRAIIPRAHVGASRIHQTLLQDAGNLPILAVEQGERRGAQLGYGFESRVNASIVKGVRGP